jgi:hypothetical protein
MDSFRNIFLRTRFAAYLSSVWLRIDKKTAGLVAALFILLLFGDTLLPLLGHFLHVLIEVIEAVLEHFLESVFDLSTRQAQIVLFYGGLAIAIYFVSCFSRKAYFTALRAYAVARARWHRIVESPKTVAWFQTMIIAGALGATLYLFT